MDALIAQIQADERKQAADADNVFDNISGRNATASTKSNIQAKLRSCGSATSAAGLNCRKKICAAAAGKDPAARRCEVALRQSPQRLIQLLTPRAQDGACNEARPVSTPPPPEIHEGELPLRSNAEPGSMRDIIRLDEEMMVWSDDGAAAVIESIMPFFAIAGVIISLGGIGAGVSVLSDSMDSFGMRALSVSLAALLAVGGATGAYFAWRISFGSKHSDVYFSGSSARSSTTPTRRRSFLIGTTSVRTCELASARLNWVHAPLWRWNWWSTSRTTRRPGARASLWRPPCRGVRHASRAGS